MNAAPPAVEVESLTKVFRRVGDRRTSLKERIVKGAPKRTIEFLALDDVSLEIPQGSFFGLVGHNGSGKSTLLKILARIYRPTSGRVAVHGRIAALLELGAGFHPELSGLENIRLNGSILGLGRDQVEGSIEEIVEFSGLGDFVNEPVKHYSSGMFVRLGFSVAVHMNPDVLLVDEVIAVGDENFQRKCFDHLHTLRRRGVTIVLVSHSLGLVESLCDRAAWLDHGHLMALGTAPTVVHSYLSAVNEAEREQARGEPDADRAAGHGGTGEVVVRTARSVDSGGEALPFVPSGAPIRIRLDLDVSPGGEPFVVEVGLHHESGVLVSGVGSVGVSAPFPGDGSVRQVDLVLPGGELNSGRYRISAKVTDEASLRLIDTATDVGTLVVRPGLGRERLGLVTLDHRFEPSGESR